MSFLGQTIVEVLVAPQNSSAISRAATLSVGLRIHCVAQDVGANIEVDV